VNALMERTIHVRISWIDWLVVGAPFSFALSVVLYFLLTKMMAPLSGAAGQDDSISGNPVNLAAGLLPMTAAEWRLLLFSVLLLGFWATENKLHSLDSSTVAVAAVAAMFMPNVVLNWKQVQPRVPWGILIQLGVGVGLGTALLKTGAAGWLAHFVVDEFAVAQLSILRRP
jgi:sodium-dependent dicarboxylate transporter 2/3/5